MGKHTLRRTKNKWQDNNLLTKPVYLGDKDIPMSVELLQYDSSRLEIRNVPLQSSIKDSIDTTKVNWFRILGISDATQVSRICRELGLHGFDVKDILSNQQMVKIVAYDNVTLILMPSFYIENDPNNTNKGNGIDNMQIAFIFGKNFIVSFQEAAVPIFDDVKKGVEESYGLLRQKGADFLLH